MHDRIAKEIEVLRENGKEVPEDLIKREAELKWKVRRLCIHRKKWFDAHFHRLSKYLALFLYYMGHDELIIGIGALKSKRNCRLGSKTAEKFVQIPYRSLIDKIKYKCEALGIKVREVDETYTSKANCLVDEILENYKVKEFSGKRISRGLYKAKLNGEEIVFNADCNASFNILRKGAKIPKLTELLDRKILIKKLCNPRRFGFFKFIEFTQRVIPKSSRWRTGLTPAPRRIGDSPAPLGAGSNPATG